MASFTFSVAIPSNYCDVSNIEVDAVHIYNIADELRRSCSITMKADLEHFMIGFSHVQLACGQYIKLYYDSNDRGKPDVSTGKAANMYTHTYTHTHTCTHTHTPG